MNESKHTSVQTPGHWSQDPPDTEGFWWLYGDDEFGTMGGNYSGAFPVELDLHMVIVRKLGSGLAGISRGRLIPLTPFDREARKSGYVGFWQKAITPELPESDLSTALYLSNEERHLLP